MRIATALLLILCSFLIVDRVTTAQVVAAPLKPTAWPPHPSQIVNLNGGLTFAAGGVGVVYNVPSDSWLVITDVAVRATNILGLYESFGGSETARIERDFLNSDTNVTASTDEEWRRSILGYTFRPGSSVVFRGEPTGTPGVNFNMLGYLVK